jgi:hypothetical protein
MVNVMFAAQEGRSVTQSLKATRARTCSLTDDSVRCMLITSTIFYALKSYKGGTSASRLEAMEERICRPGKSQYMFAQIDSYFG